jgi:hypothetical protein
MAWAMAAMALGFFLETWHCLELEATKKHIKKWELNSLMFAKDVQNA